ncbi:MAG: Outer membrane protein assembly factor YaeT precursor [uncultured Thiotrichaceae bacterium]|uniref:Outer membrane protein assembly factor BamA n=1 Tax=uncultured Thiotrichaceae bacterium TaxID=298394 RepID=A0A6S6SKE0_9GAMM|nr:MAG: Outer membrane protein assembly factor YaeT precursor [uncultured Thiotrichaceae bacterium]
MNSRILSLSLASCLFAVSQGAWAADFTVKDIQINGIERVDPGTVLANIPVKVGDQYQDHMTANIVRSLYKTGLFDNVSLQQSANVLVVNVSERRAVGEINFSGNKAFTSEELQALLLRAGIRKGQTLNSSALSRVEAQIKQLYVSKGKYGVAVKSSVTDLARNRVAVNVDITEGKEARVRRVKITGNRAFTEAELLKTMETGERKAYQFFGDRDRYTKQKLVGDLDRLTAFYRDKGYLKFKVLSSNVNLSDDKKDIFVNISVDEGDRYRVGNIDISGVPGLTKADTQSVLKMKKGDVFSQQLLEESRKSLRLKVEQGGHAFAKVGLRPQIDEARKVVNLSFLADKGKRVYVRRINIKGNYRTRDEVYRREMRQLESSWYSREKVDRSRVRLQRLPYVQSVKIQQTPVAGTRDQVDLEVTVTEQLSNQFTAGVGFSQSQGVIFNLGLKQQNFLGSGKSLGVNANNSAATKRFSLSYNDPYHTIDGIGRGFDIFYNKTDTEEDDLVSSYISDSFGGNLNYTLPLSEENSLRFSVGYEKRDIKETSTTPQYIKDFLTDNGDSYDELLGTVSYVHDTRNRTIFPTEGNRQSFSFEAGLPGSDLEYYKLRYKGANYWDLNDTFTFALKGGVSYGDGFGDTSELPFFERFYAGGIGSVRGFEKNTLGVQDENDDAVGGDFSFNTTAELSFPAPFAQDLKTLRMTAFVDAGNVFDSVDDFESDELRTSVGIGATWISPFGPLTLSYAQPLNDEDGDDVQEIQFSVGATF